MFQEPIRLIEAWPATSVPSSFSRRDVDIVHGSSPEEMHFQYPHLSLAQIHAALSYYYDHQTDIDAEIQSRWQEVNKLPSRKPNSPLQQRLEELKRQA